jgi:carboxypeptidase Taq
MGYEEHPYDALLLRYEPGMTAARLRALFADLRTHTLPLVQAIAAKAPPRADFLDQDYPEEDQRAFGLGISQAMGYNLHRGRLDRSAHPFEVSFTREDVRITTRYQRHYLPAALFGIFHETGHALYEQGVSPDLTRTALTTDFLNQYAVGGVSFGMHESQSRLRENLVGRSRPFWQHHFPALRAVFPTQLADVSAEEFYCVVNRVRPSLIRVEADELTYNFHIMLRVELEIAMLEGSVAVRDLPDMWRSIMESTLGITPPDDTRGVLQDIHWSTGYLGSFCTYTIGNVISVQLFEAARQQVAGLDDSLAQGDYAPLLAWLTENVYRHGRAYSVSELLTRATGRDLTNKPYLNYLKAKYTDLYGL